jgi:hypothetical protein
MAVRDKYDVAQPTRDLPEKVRRILQDETALDLIHGAFKRVMSSERSALDDEIVALFMDALEGGDLADVKVHVMPWRASAFEKCVAARRDLAST